MAYKRVKLPNGASTVRVFQPRLEGDISKLESPIFRLIVQRLLDSEFKIGNLVFSANEYKQPQPPARQFLNSLRVFSKTVKGLTGNDSSVLCTFNKWPDAIQCQRNMIISERQSELYGVNRPEFELIIHLGDPTCLRRIELWFWSVTLLKIRIETIFRHAEIRNKCSDLLNKLGVAQAEISKSPGLYI